LKGKKMAIKYNDEQMQETSRESGQAEKPKNLPPLETWLDSDKTVKDLIKMGYSYEEILFGEQIDG